MKKACSALAPIFIAMLFLSQGLTGTPYSLAADQPQVQLGEGRIGRASWGVWLESAARKGAESSHLCVDMVLVRPIANDLWARGESRECNAVSVAAPVVESLDGGSGRRRRTVWAVVVASDAYSLLINIGNHGPRHVRVGRIGEQEAHRLGLDRIGFWVHGFGGNACLHRLIAYGRDGSRLSDSGKLPC